MNRIARQSLVAGGADPGSADGLIFRPGSAPPATTARRHNPRAASRRHRYAWIAALLLLPFTCLAGKPVTVGSKKFTESYVLGEITKRLLRAAGITADHRQGMGGTIILWQALQGGQIDAYPEYTGTITQEILKRSDTLTFEQIAQELGKSGVGITRSIGFNNTYALVMRRGRAQQLNVRTIGDLRAHPELQLGFTHEFLDRRDGWQRLAAEYQLSSGKLRGIDHALGYQELVSGSNDVKDAYSTDAKIEELDLLTLEDDQRFFPRYDAVLLFRANLQPAAIAALHKLEGTIDEAKMIRLNAEAERTRDYGRAASLFFNNSAASSDDASETFGRKLMRWT